MVQASLQYISTGPPGPKGDPGPIGPTGPPGPGAAELAYIVRTSNVVLGAIDTTILTSPPLSFDVPTDVMIGLFIPQLLAQGNTHTIVSLLVNGVDIGKLADLDINSDASQAIFVQHRYSASVGVLVFQLVGRNIDPGTVTIFAGSGGAGQWLPAYMRITAA